MEAVLAEAPRPVTLEVIEQNEPAKRLYDSLGFDVVRMLEVWSLTGDVPVSEARPLVRPRPLGQAALPWQRQDASLPENIEGLETDQGTALFRIANERVSIVQLDAADEAAAATLLAAARARGRSLHYVNVPEGDPASAALRAARRDARPAPVRNAPGCLALARARPEVDVAVGCVAVDLRELLGARTRGCRVRQGSRRAARRSRRRSASRSSAHRAASTRAPAAPGSGRGRRRARSGRGSSRASARSGGRARASCSRRRASRAGCRRGTCRSASPARAARSRCSRRRARRALRADRPRSTG